jgi:chorismate lyase/3-hydroxybenzoate synthase
MASATEDGMSWAATDDLLFGAFELPADSGAALEASTRRAYSGALAGAVRLGYPHLLRTWNVVPAINRVEGGLERYRSFCRGRAEAFEAHHGRGFEPLLPASSAVGSAGGALAMWFLAGREPGVHRENPRQVSAYAYPPRYGPRSPSFARATRCPPGAAGGRLLLSGTASIVGHRSLHPLDVDRQLEETLRNLVHLLDAGDELSSLRVYVRRAGDAGRVRAAIEARVGRELPAVYLRADICREELLVEVEGVA